MTKELENRQMAFCEAWLRGLTGNKSVSATEAYLEAYPDVTRESARVCASKLLTNANIKEYIQSRMSTMVMGTNEVLIRLADLSRGAEKDSDRLRALELIGRTHGMFLDRSDITSGGQTISLADYLNGLTEVSKKKKTSVTVVGE